MELQWQPWASTQMNYWKYTSQHVQLTLCRRSIIKGAGYLPENTNIALTRHVVAKIQARHREDTHFLLQSGKRVFPKSLLCPLGSLCIFSCYSCNNISVLTDEETGFTKWGDLAELLQGLNGRARIQTQVCSNLSIIAPCCSQCIIS